MEAAKGSPRRPGWKSARARFQRVKRLSWPARLEDVVEYLEVRAGGPCGKTCRTTFLSGSSFMEKLGQVPVEMHFSSNELAKGPLLNSRGTYAALE